MRLSALLTVLAAAVAGLMFAPVFGAAALALPFLAVALPVLATTELTARRPALSPWRPVISMVTGLLALTELLLWHTTTAGIPTGATFAALGRGISESWLLTLRSTWPARPEPDLLLFVPLLVLVAAVAGVELLGRRPLLALIPSAVVIAVSQLFHAITGAAAVGAALGYAAVAIALALVTAKQPLSRTLAFVVPVAIVGALAGVAIPTQDPVSLRDQQSVPPPANPVTNPLNQVADKLRRPSDEVFTYTSSTQVDRWRLLALDEFDGVTWRTSGKERLLGDELPSHRKAALRSAKIESAPGPWLPSQPLPASAKGPRLLVNEEAGSLRGDGSSGYELSWWEPEVDLDQLTAAAIDPDVPIGDVGAVPAGVAELAKQAVGDRRPSAQTAIALDRFLSRHYQLATGPTPPTGSGWPQLKRFLLEDKVGTSEQFAAAYVVMARMLGIPARLVVGYRAPEGTGTVTVRNRDVLVWPEVALDGIGWVPLDPTRKAGDVPNDGGLAQKAGEAKQQLPEATDLPEPVLPSQESTVDAPGETPWALIGLGVVLFVAGWLAGVPLWRLAKARWRRKHGVLGAWAEARDQLERNGVALTPGMTVRDAAQATAHLDPSVPAGLTTLALAVDNATWSPEPFDDAETAWQAVKTVRTGLTRQSRRARIIRTLTRH